MLHKHPGPGWAAWTACPCLEEHCIAGLEGRTHPAAQAMRPQLGSCPKTAALTRDEAAMDLAMVSAALSSGAPPALTSIRQVAPSPSHATDLARPCMLRMAVVRPLGSKLCSGGD